MLRLKVTGMTCGHCLQSVTNAVQSVAPQARVEVSLDKSEVNVIGTTDAKPVIAAITDAGYDVESLPT